MITVEVQKLKTEVVARKLDHLQNTFAFFKVYGFCTEEISKEILYTQEVYAIHMFDYISLATRKGAAND